MEKDNLKFLSVMILILLVGFISLFALSYFITIDLDPKTNQNLTVDNLLVNGNFTLNKSVYDDFAVNGLNLVSSPFAPELTVFNNSAYYCYAGSVRNEYSYGSTELYHGWTNNIMLYPHIHSVKSTYNAGNYTFQLLWTLADSNHTLNGVTNVTVNNGVQGIVYIVDFNDPINATTFGIGSMFSFTIRRLQDATTDNYPDCVGIAQVSVHAEFNTLGSNGIYNK
jgi:hypothetical protein